MKNQQLQTKRQNSKKGFRKLHAKVSPTRRKQRVSAAANPEMLDSNVPNASISRSLTVILLLHVVAIGAVYIGVQWNKERKLSSSDAVAPAATVDLSNLNAGLRTEFAVSGDTYETFAARHKVEVAELKRVNNSAQIFAGKPLFLPAEKIKVVAAEVPVSDRPPLPATNNVVNLEIPKAQIVEPSPAVIQTYKVKSGDSIWRISKKHGVTQEALMTLNNLKSAKDLKAGMTLKVPVK